MSALRIVHCLGSMDLRDGGVVRAVLDLCPALAARGQRVTLITQNDADAPGAWKRPDAHDAGLPRCVTIARPADARDVLREADVVHLHAMWSTLNDRIASMCRRLGTPYIISPHGMLDDWCMAQRGTKKRVYLMLVGGRTLRGAAAVHCTAEAELDQAGKWFPAGKGVVVPLPFDLSDYQSLPGPEMGRARAGFKGNEPLLLYLSRLHPKKGVDVLIRTVGAMRDGGEPITLAIAGGGDEPYVASLHALVEELKLKDRVRFVGFVKGREKVSLYQAASVFVLPSSQENFGYVIVEAMAAGTPVVTTRGVALWPQLERDRVAVLAEPTVDALLGAIRPLLRDPVRARELGQRARAWCLREMDPTRIIDGFLGMYERAAANRPDLRSPAPSQSRSR